MQPLSARSIVASTLLGTVPPELPSRLLVAFADRFGVSEGATRVALSRMMDRGELTNTDGRYALAGALLERHHRQEQGLRTDPRPWDRRWEMFVIRPGGRDGRTRAAIRRAFEHLRLGERRDGIWMRPANLDPDRLPDARRVVDAQADRFLADPDNVDPAVLMSDLFDLEAWSTQARELIDAMTDLLPRLVAGDTDALVPGFELAAAVLRHVVADPAVPHQIAPPAWVGPDLRTAYAEYDPAYRALLSSFFRSV